MSNYNYVTNVQLNGTDIASYFSPSFASGLSGSLSPTNTSFAYTGSLIPSVTGFYLVNISLIFPSGITNTTSSTPYLVFLASNASTIPSVSKFFYLTYMYGNNCASNIVFLRANVNYSIACVGGASSSRTINYTLYCNSLTGLPTVNSAATYTTDINSIPNSSITTPSTDLGKIFMPDFETPFVYQPNFSSGNWAQSTTSGFYYLYDSSINLNVGNNGGWYMVYLDFNVYSTSSQSSNTINNIAFGLCTANGAITGFLGMFTNMYGYANGNYYNEYGANLGAYAYFYLAANTNYNLALWAIKNPVVYLVTNYNIYLNKPPFPLQSSNNSISNYYTGYSFYSTITSSLLDIGASLAPNFNPVLYSNTGSGGAGFIGFGLPYISTNYFTVSKSGYYFIQLQVSYIPSTSTSYNVMFGINAGNSSLTNSSSDNNTIVIQQLSYCLSTSQQQDLYIGGSSQIPVGPYIATGYVNLVTGTNYYFFLNQNASHSNVGTVLYNVYINNPY